MVTSKNPYIRKIGKNLLTHFLFNINADNKDYLDMLFVINEREALGKRILILIYILEGYPFMQIVERLHCGKSTVSKIEDQLDKFKGDRYKLLKFLRVVYYSQFPKKSYRSYSPRTVKGSLRVFGFSEEVAPEDTKVKII